VDVLSDAWGHLDDPWQAAFRLAWEGRQAGSVPVGAVVTDQHGSIVATGRNRRLDASAPAGQLAGTNIAHAEVNALAQLAPGNYSDHMLYSTLEPCLLCTAAATHSHIGVIRYAATDSLCAGLRDLPTLNERIADRWPRWEEPIVGPFALLSAALVVGWDLVHRPTDPVLDLHRSRDPALLDIAARVNTVCADEMYGRALDEVLPRLANALDSHF
jgi:tRNA(Arg) A34 adenosine deaminase TadA